jgi:chromosome segregation ATPase
VNESFSESHSSSSSNLLEINRYLRQQKEQLEERYESLKLDHEIFSQRFAANESELELARKQAEIYEAEIGQLRQSLNRHQEPGSQTSGDADSFTLLLDTNRRLKEEVDTANGENSRLTAEVRRVEEELLNLRASLNSSELRNESITGENGCMRQELSKWRERVDALLRTSDMGEEWTRMRDETAASEARCAALAVELEEARRGLGELSAKCEAAAVELAAVRSEAVGDKQRHQADLDTLRADKAKREDMLRGFFADTKEVVVAVQRELEIPDPVKTGGGRANFKEDMATLKKIILERLGSSKEELLGKARAVESAHAEVQETLKRVEEAENRVKEKDIKIGQMTNFVNSTKNRLSSQQTTIAELTKELNELREKLHQSSASPTGLILFLLQY